MRRRGLAVNVWNRTPSRAFALEADGARAFEDAAEAARGCARAHLCLRDDAAVDAVLDAALPGLAPGTPVVDHTTVLPQKVGARAARLRDLGHPFLHAPVFMGPPQALEASGVMMCSGPRRIVDALRPALEEMSGDLRYLGERDDLAAVYKLVGNAMILAVVGGMSDAFAIAERNGIGRSEAYELFSFYSPAGQIAGRGKRMAAGDYQPTWTLDMSHKDATLMQATAGVALPVIDAIEGAMRAAIDRGLGADDLSVIAKR
jgi:3-hydroxyisobutyrate dehydrogenase